MSPGATGQLRLASAHRTPMSKPLTCSPGGADQPAGTPPPPGAAAGCQTGRRHPNHVGPTVEQSFLETLEASGGRAPCSWTVTGCRRACRSPRDVAGVRDPGFPDDDGHVPIHDHRPRQHRHPGIRDDRHHHPVLTPPHRWRSLRQASGGAGLAAGAKPAIPARSRRGQHRQSHCARNNGQPSEPSPVPRSERAHMHDQAPVGLTGEAGTCADHPYMGAAVSHVRRSELAPERRVGARLSSGASRR